MLGAEPGRWRGKGPSFARLRRPPIKLPKLYSLTDVPRRHVLIAREIGDGRVAFLPGTRVTLKGLKPKGFREIPQTIGDHIKARRLAFDLRQKEAAVQLGTDQWTLINWEKDRTQPAIASYPAVVAFLGYDPGTSAGDHRRRC